MQLVLSLGLMHLQVVKICREHGLYSALIYLFNKGLDDFRSPLEELMTVAKQTPIASQAHLVGFVPSSQLLLVDKYLSATRSLILIFETYFYIYCWEEWV